VWDARRRPDRGIPAAAGVSDFEAVRLGAPIAALAAFAFALAAPASSAPERLAHNGLIAYADEVHAAELYMSDADGNGVTRLTDDPAPSRWPSLSPDGSKVAFASNRDGMWNVYVMNLDGSGLVDVSQEANLPWGFDAYPDWSPDGTKLAFSANTDVRSGLDIVVYDFATKKLTDLTPGGTGDDWRPRWSPDGRRIAFANAYRSFHVFVVNADGSGLRQLTFDSGWQIEPTWSPDGTKIAYTAWPNQRSDIFVMDADGSNVRDLTNTPRSMETQASWSPSGIAFRSDRDGTDGVYTMGPDGSRPRRLSARNTFEGDPNFSRDGRRLVFMSGREARSGITVTSPVTGFDKTLTSGPWFDTDPAWSPDGKQLAFARSPSRSVSDIYRMNASGGQVRNLTRGRGLNWDPTWSPDGTRIAFVRFEAFGAQIWVMNANGTKQRALTSTGSWNNHPSWSPDGSRIVYSALRNGNYDLYVLDLRTRRERRITKTYGPEFSPAWSPDGKHIAFVAWRPDDAISDIWLVRPDGSGRHPLTNAYSSNSSPAWSPDGTHLVYVKDDTFGHDTSLWTISAAGGEEHYTIDFNWPQDTPSWQPVR
jgi:TolB protein